MTPPRGHKEPQRFCHTDTKVSLLTPDGLEHPRMNKTLVMAANRWTFNQSRKRERCTETDGKRNRAINQSCVAHENEEKRLAGHPEKNAKRLKRLIHGTANGPDVRKQKTEQKVTQNHEAQQQERC